MAARLIFSLVNNEFKKVFKKIQQEWPGCDGIFYFACCYCAPDHSGDFTLFQGYKNESRGIYQRSSNGDEFAAVDLSSRPEMNTMRLKSKKAQSVLEYAILLTAVAMVFVTMGAYMQRAVQAKLLKTQTELNKAVR